MVTIKLPYTIEDKAFFEVLKELRRKQTIVYNIAFNRFQEDKIDQEVRVFIKVTDLNSWFEASAIGKAKTSVKVRGNGKVIFGGKHNLKQYLKKKITKEEYRANKQRPLYSVGECNTSGKQGGNRFFKIKDNTIVFQPKRGQKFILQLPKLSKKYQIELRKLEEASNNKTKPITFSLTDTHICITYEEFKSETITKLNSGRVIALDLNPNRIGYSIIDHKTNEILEANCIEFENLNKKLGLSNTHLKSKKQNNKRQFELFQIVKFLINKAIHYKCSQFVIEDLNVAARDHNKGKGFNRLVNNCWNRVKVIQKIKKDCFIYGITLKEVNPAYSSVIGNIVHRNYPDPINASLEINRRGYHQFQSGKFYPAIVDVKDLNEQWKQTLDFSPKSWKELSDWIKKSKIKYRLSFEDFPHKVFKFFSVKSGCFIKTINNDGMKAFNITGEL